MLVWERSRINYKFIFEFDPRNNLDFKEYLEVDRRLLFFIVILYHMLLYYYYIIRLFYF